MHSFFGGKFRNISKVFIKKERKTLKYNITELINCRNLANFLPHDHEILCDAVSATSAFNLKLDSWYESGLVRESGSRGSTWQQTTGGADRNRCKAGQQLGSEKCFVGIARDT